MNISTITKRVEILAGLTEKSDDFVQRLTLVLSQGIDHLSEDRKQIFSKVMAESNTETLVRMITIFSEKLSDQSQATIQANLGALNGNQRSFAGKRASV